MTTQPKTQQTPETSTDPNAPTPPAAAGHPDPSNPHTTPNSHPRPDTPPRPTDPNAHTAPQRLVPVTEAIRYRKRAQAAENELDAIKGQLQDTSVELEQARQTVSALDRRQKIDRLLADSDAVDLEVARMLTEAAVEMMDEPDVKIAIEDLKRHKPYLFRNKPQPLSPASPMAPRTRDPLNRTTTHAAQVAATTGDRRDLLRYLRLRRGK